MRIVLVPNEVRDAINEKLDHELNNTPEAAENRQAFYDILLEHYDKTGKIPPFSIQKKYPI